MNLVYNIWNISYMLTSSVGQTGTLKLFNAKPRVAWVDLKFIFFAVIR